MNQKTLEGGIAQAIATRGSTWGGKNVQFRSQCHISLERVTHKRGGQPKQEWVSSNLDATGDLGGKK